MKTMMTGDPRVQSQGHHYKNSSFWIWNELKFLSKTLFLDCKNVMILMRNKSDILNVQTILQDDACKSIHFYGYDDDIMESDRIKLFLSSSSPSPPYCTYSHQPLFSFKIQLYTYIALHAYHIFLYIFTSSRLLCFFSFKIKSIAYPAAVHCLQEICRHQHKKRAQQSKINTHLHMARVACGMAYIQFINEKFN